MKTFWRSVAATMLAAATLGNLGMAQGVLIDQRYDPTAPVQPPEIFPGSWYPLYPYHLPFGQEFSPSLSSVDFFEFLVQTDTPAGGAGTFRVVIHRDGVSGEALGASQGVSIGAHVYEAVAHVDFDSSIPLVPGERYVAELVPISGGMVHFAAFDFGGYAAGGMIDQGAAVSGDLWFREGIVVPEPRVLVLLAASIGLVCIVRRRAPNKSRQPTPTIALRQSDRAGFSVTALGCANDQLMTRDRD